jgi:hypothetical protein
LSTSSNPGCLAAIKRLLGGNPKPTPIGIDTTLESPETDSFPYRIRDDFLSPAEQSFYLVLKNMMGEHLAICPKVSLADIFFVTRPNENKSAYNRINRKHVDFLICEPKTMKPRFAIELDDSSHQRPAREERDDFVDAVFKAADLPLLHIPVLNAYNTTELGVLFKQSLQQGNGLSEDQKSLNGINSIPVVSPRQTPNQVPFCPKCGVLMILRTAKNSERAGQQFFGCQNFPKCREIMPYKP